MTSDPAGAKDFYTKLIGWGTRPWEGGGEPYTLWTNNENSIGGVLDLPDEVRESGAPPHWLSYVGVDDIKATVSRVEELGGSALHGPVEMPDAGSFAVLADPQGAVFAVYQSAEEGAAVGDAPGIGEFSWHELATSDYKKALSFYSEIFGWKPAEAMDMGEGGIYQLYGGGGKPLGGMFTKPNEMPGPPMWLFYVLVRDVNEASKRVVELGGQVINGPMEVSGGDLIAQCLDPQGALFAVHSSASS